MLKIILLVTSLSTALITGLLYSFAVSINPGLARVTDTEYLKAMQNINRAIINPWFLISFVGTLLLLPVCTYLQYRNGPQSSFMLLLAATIIYAIGVVGITALRNIPLNEALDKVNIASAGAEELRLQREKFEGPWGRWHLARTICAIVTLVLVLIAMLKNH